MANLIGVTLKGRYRIVESIGRGGMADVYKVWDEERAVYLALKVLRQDLAQDPIFLRRFQREAKALAGLQHPHIVRFYGLERDDLLAFLLMEYVDGVSLQAEILRSEGKPLPKERIREVMQAVCSALHYAHHQGLVHCDIKPGNILIDKHGQIYLTDFGIARGMDAATSTMVGIGTPAYMAPELIKGQDPTPQTDIYALGIVLYEMLTGGERPFTGERATITGTTADKVRWEHLQLEPTPVSQFNPKVKENMQEIIDCCLQKDPSRRFKDVMQVRDLFNGSQVSSSVSKNHKEEENIVTNNEIEDSNSVVRWGDDFATDNANDEIGKEKIDLSKKENIHGPESEISLFLKRLKNFPALNIIIKIILAAEMIFCVAEELLGVLAIFLLINGAGLLLLNRAFKIEKDTTVPSIFWGLFVIFQPILFLISSSRFGFWIGGYILTLFPVCISIIFGISMLIKGNQIKNPCYRIEGILELSIGNIYFFMMVFAPYRFYGDFYKEILIFVFVAIVLYEIGLIILSRKLSELLIPNITAKSNFGKMNQSVWNSIKKEMKEHPPLRIFLILTAVLIITIFIRNYPYYFNPIFVGIYLWGLILLMIGTQKEDATHNFYSVLGGLLLIVALYVVLFSFIGFRYYFLLQYPYAFTLGLGLGEWIYGNSYNLSDNKKKGWQLILTGFVCIILGLFYWSLNTILILEIVICLLIYGIHYLKLRNKESNKI